MTTSSQNQPMDTKTEGGQDELLALSGEIAAQLEVKLPNAQRGALIAAGLLRRARQSALAHRDFLTLRREARAYAQVSAGVRCHVLRHGRGIRIELVQLAPDAALIWPDDVLAQEILVMTGTLHASHGGTLAQHDLCMRRDSSNALCAGCAGAHLYVRQLIDLESLPAAEQTWWRSDDATQAAQWEPMSEGVEIKGLRCVGDVVSTLARIAPGALVVDHGHRLDEDCMMLQGDLFLGDILLRENDYQLAPAGGAHLNSMSDTGALFYFHGAMPTAVG
jgi:hypothetical protein